MSTIKREHTPKPVVQVFNGPLSGRKEFTVLETHNTLRHVPGDKVSEGAITECLVDGFNVVLKKK